MDGQRHIIIAIMCPWEWRAWDIVRSYCKLLHKCLWIEQDQTTFQKLAKIWSSPSPVRNLGRTLPRIWSWVPQECILGFRPPTSKDIQSLAVAKFFWKVSHCLCGEGCLNLAYWSVLKTAKNLLNSEIVLALKLYSSSLIRKSTIDIDNQINCLPCTKNLEKMRSVSSHIASCGITQLWTVTQITYGLVITLNDDTVLL